jgi:hypothetical protein
VTAGCLVDHNLAAVVAPGRGRQAVLAADHPILDRSVMTSIGSLRSIPITMG